SGQDALGSPFHQWPEPHQRYRERPHHWRARPRRIGGHRRGGRVNVALFVTCVADLLAPAAALATAKLLRRLGCTVTFPEAQTCCGQPAFNSGYPEQARRAAECMLGAFEGTEYVVSPSGSCAGMIRHSYADLFAGDPALAERARLLAG